VDVAVDTAGQHQAIRGVDRPHASFQAGRQRDDPAIADPDIRFESV
jgi:hypothetical protein